jgi:hypothetical protein
MNKIKLPSMVEYISEIGVPGTTDKQFTDSVMLFFNFLSQQPNVGMVVAAVFENGEWRILEKPIFDFNNEYDGEKRREFAIALKEFETALDNVIFEGFEYDGSEEGFIYVKNGETLLIFDTENKTLFLYNSENNYTTEIKTIEDLTPYNLTMTSKFSKELGL